MNLNDIKPFFHSDQTKLIDEIIPVIVTLISGLIIIVSFSPAYLRELNAFTLLLLSIAAALPIWALNQLLWWHLGRRLSSQVIARIVMILQVSGKEKKALSFAISQLMKAIDIAHFIPSKNIANLVTIVTIYIGAAANYFTTGSPARLYGYILLLGFFVWLVALVILHKVCKKIDVEPLKEAWVQLKTNDELIAHINALFERIEKLVRESVFFGERKSSSAEAAGAPEPSGTLPE
jgi:4-amino-4-deoxy-L-arabinose transferase-like glycosyltransferase